MTNPIRKGLRKPVLHCSSVVLLPAYREWPVSDSLAKREAVVSFTEEICLTCLYCSIYSTAISAYSLPALSDQDVEKAMNSSSSLPSKMSFRIFFFFIGMDNGALQTTDKGRGSSPVAGTAGRLSSPPPGFSGRSLPVLSSDLAYRRLFCVQTYDWNIGRGKRSGGVFCPDY